MALIPSQIKSFLGFIPVNVSPTSKMSSFSSDEKLNKRKSFKFLAIKGKCLKVPLFYDNFSIVSSINYFMICTLERLFE